MIERVYRKKQSYTEMILAFVFALLLMAVVTAYFYIETKGQKQKIEIVE